MTVLDSLPTELIFQILEILLASEEAMPVIGYNAIWTTPDPPDIPGFPQKRIPFLDEDEKEEEPEYFPVKALRM